jgi:hypothetical protein
MKITNLAHVTPDELRKQLKAMDNGELLAQEITQKAAIHAINMLLRVGCTESKAREMLRSLETFGQHISAECVERGIGTVDHPSGN